MNILNKIISIFNPPPNITPPSKKTIRQLDLLSDVWVKDGDIVYKGMVWDITRRHITVIYGEDSSYKFRISKQEDIIEQDKLGRPVIVGTISIEKSDYVSHLLK